MSMTRALFARLHKAIDDNRPSDAVLLLTQMIDSQHRSVYDRDRNYLERLTELGDLQWELGDIAGAEDHYALALRLYEKFFVQHDAVAISIVRRLCEVLEVQGRTEELEETLNRAYFIVERLQSAQQEIELASVRTASAHSATTHAVGSQFSHFPRALRVLVVEDNPDDAELLHEYTTSQQLPLVLEVADRLGLAIERAQSASHDVILLDLSLPDSDPKNTLSAVKKVAPKTPIIVLTGLDDTELAIKALQSGARDYLIKGRLDGTLLANAISKTLEQRRSDADAELESHVREDLTRQFVQHSSAGVMILSVDFKIININHAMYNAMGWDSTSELLGHNLAEILTSVPVDTLNDLWSNRDPSKLIEIEFSRNRQRAAIKRIAKVWALKDIEGKPRNFVLALQ